MRRLSDKKSLLEEYDDFQAKWRVDGYKIADLIGKYFDWLLKASTGKRFLPLLLLPVFPALFALFQSQKFGTAFILAYGIACALFILNLVVPIILIQTSGGELGKEEIKHKKKIAVNCGRVCYYLTLFFALAAVVLQFIAMNTKNG